MNHVRSIGTMVLTAVVLVVGQVLIMPRSVAASTDVPPRCLRTSPCQLPPCCC